MFERYLLYNIVHDHIERSLWYGTNEEAARARAGTKVRVSRTNEAPGL